MGRIGFVSKSERSNPLHAVDPRLAGHNSTDRQALQFSNRRVLDAVSCLRKARVSKSPEDVEGAMRNLILAAEKMHLIYAINPKGSELSTQALKASLRMERWARRVEARALNRAGIEQSKEKLVGDLRFSEHESGIIAMNFEERISDLKAALRKAASQTI